MVKQLSLLEEEKVTFLEPKRGLQKKTIVINDEEVLSSIACQDTSFNDMRDWWAAYLSQEEVLEVSPWSGKGKELHVAELFSGPGGLAQGVKTFCETIGICLLYTSPSPRDRSLSRMPSSA